MEGVRIFTGSSCYYVILLWKSNGQGQGQEGARARGKGKGQGARARGKGEGQGQGQGQEWPREDKTQKSNI